MTVQISADDAVNIIKPYNRVFIQGGIAEPSSILSAFESDVFGVKEVDFISVLVPGLNHFIPTNFQKSARLTTFFVFGEIANPFSCDRTKFLPIHYSQITKFLDTEAAIDVVLLQMSPPNEQGKCSLGLSVDFIPTLLTGTALIIAEINQQMPFVEGSPVIEIDAVDYVVYADHPLPTTTIPKTTRVIDAVSSTVAELINDGDTIQYGIGGIPNAVLAKLNHHRDLGLHSGMLTEQVQPLIDGGIFNGTKKQIDTGKHVTGFVLGSNAFYHWAAKQKNLLFRPVSYTHRFQTISAIKNFTSINSAVQIDLLGQANAEMVNGKQISGTGGSLDFIRGAKHALSGRSIIALPATAAKGTQSRITAHIDQNAVVTIPRSDIDYVVTEYGVAELRYKSILERAEALIAIAAPQFREPLKEQFANRLSK